MTDDLSPTIERLQTALRETADQLEISALAEPSAVSNARGGVRRPLLVAAAAAVAFLVVGSLLADDGGSRVETPAAETNREVTPQQLPSAEADLQAYLRPEATNTQIESVRQVLDRDPRVLRFAYLDQEAAYIEFVELFVDRENLVENTDPEDLPPSFRIELRDADDRSFAADLETNDVVDAVQTPPRGLRPAER
jgi:hypothetical protein